MSSPGIQDLVSVPSHFPCPDSEHRRAPIRQQHELKQKGLPNSRGIILSGPPGTGKTMMAKSLATQANVTTILISAEMIQGPSQVKRAFKVGRKLAPTLMIIEDIDTAGTVSRRFTDHPILGEYLQAMDGMESNDGMLILATTNHTENIDPAISDRPGRFDRIIDVPLPNVKQRELMIQNLLTNMPSEDMPKSVISAVAKKSEGLSGAWLREGAERMNKAKPPQSSAHRPGALFAH